MNRQDRLDALSKLHASMDVDMEGAPNDLEIAFLDAVVEKNLTVVQETK